MYTANRTNLRYQLLYQYTFWMSANITVTPVTVPDALCSYVDVSSFGFGKKNCGQNISHSWRFTQPTTASHLTVVRAQRTTLPQNWTTACHSLSPILLSKVPHKGLFVWFNSTIPSDCPQNYLKKWCLTNVSELQGILHVLLKSCLLGLIAYETRCVVYSTLLYLLPLTGNFP